MIRAAPVSFCVSVVLGTALIGSIIFWHYFGLVSTQEANIHYLTQQRDDARSDLAKLQAYKELYGLPLKRQALIFAEQIHELSQDWKDTDPPDLKYHHIQKYLYEFENEGMWIADGLAKNGKRSDELWKQMHKSPDSYNDIRMIESEIQRLAISLPDKP